MAMLGHRVNALQVRGLRRRQHSSSDTTGASVAEAGAWARLARRVMRRPARYVAAVLLILAVLALPLLHVRFGSVDERVLPPGDPARAVAARVATQFGGTAPSPVLVLLPDATPAQAADARQRIAQLRDVTGAQIGTQRGSATLISASYSGGFAGVPALAGARAVGCHR
ncbi:MAG: hypothetical protein ACRDOL_42300 [Streptosporangiaceae bacterium]